MEGHPFPDQDQLLWVVRRLKEVFDVCDEDADGFIRMEHLVDLGLQFGQGEEVKKLTKHLCPNAHGIINFKEFCRALFAIKGCEEILKMAVIPRPHAHHQSVTDNGYIYQNNQAKVGPPVIALAQSYPECRACTSGRGADAECDMDSCSENTNSSNSMTKAQQARNPVGSASAIPGEEQFEDYGEGVDVDFTPNSSCPEEDNGTNGLSELHPSLPSSAKQTPQKIQQMYHSDLLDIYCSQCCKKVNLLNDLEARLRNLKANSPNRKITSTAFGRQLFQANHSVFGSSQGSSTEDLFTDSIDSCDLDITEKVSYLEKKVTELESDSLANSDLKSKLKQENTHLFHRVHELEEQVKDAETKAAETLEEENKRHRDTYSKLERDRNTEIDLLCSRVQQVEEENGEMTLNVRRLKSQSEKLDQVSETVPRIMLVTTWILIMGILLLTVAV
uniref:RAB11 family interacting protein 4 (Class II) a n=1 Tax=Nothobranchius furzeri TaxID=105023 RepID=A0A1A8UQY8_NOTFU